ncbi:MAG: hypothetical protein SAL07_08070 [Oscillatoria sp. PMC 1051.18]|nr:hypothetical protein [Oscillatoria sp. PMC 1050.18]MEC5029853.1 hypothetical protein [Oscillatoria sp. PMC 1051.18]
MSPTVPPRKNEFGAIAVWENEQRDRFYFFACSYVMLNVAKRSEA